MEYDPIMKPKIIALTGKKGSGKDTAAKALIEEGYQVVKFADGLKTMVRSLLYYAGFDNDAVEGLVEGDFKEQKIPELCNQSARHIMQTLGTEWGRELIGQDLWTSLTEQRISRIPYSVVTDMRFPNELSCIKNLGGVTIRITRPALDFEDTHPSEAYIDDLAVDHEIINDSSVQDLKNRMKTLLWVKSSIIEDNIYREKDRCYRRV